MQDVEGFTNLGALQNPYYWDFIGASSPGHAPSIAPLADPLFCLEGVGEGVGLQASPPGLVFLATSHHIRTKDTALTQEIPGDLGGIGVKDQVLEQKLPPVLLSPGNCRVSGPLCRSQGQRPTCLLFCCLTTKDSCRTFHCSWDLPTLDRRSLVAQRCFHMQATRSPPRGFCTPSPFFFLHMVIWKLAAAGVGSDAQPRQGTFLRFSWPSSQTEAGKETG